MDVGSYESVSMSLDPAFLQMAIDIVLRAGEIQLDNIGKNVQIDKKGPIDLVTQVDVEIGVRRPEVEPTLIPVPGGNLHHAIILPA